MVLTDEGDLHCLQCGHYSFAESVARYRYYAISDVQPRPTLDRWLRDTWLLK